MKLKQAFYITIVLLTLMGCEEIAEFYVGMPFQPKNINSEYSPGLNVFGILKAGPSYDTLNHFFEVQQLLRLSDTASMEINEAEIILEQITGPDSLCIFTLSNYNAGRYTSSDLNPDFGEQWNYVCMYDTFIITSSTRIPDQPVLQDGSLAATEQSIAFTLQPDTTAFLYEVYYFNESDFAFERILPARDEPTYVDLSIRFFDPEGNNQLFVFAYDKNYEKYISTSNIFYKPNAYRPRYTTVEGGYGCFCSAASIKLEL